MENLTPRMCDLFNALSAPCAEHPEIWAGLLTFLQEQNAFVEESLPLRESAVVAALLNHAGQQEPDRIPLVKLTVEANRYFQESGNRERLSPHAVGRILSRLGFNHRHRTEKGWGLMLEKEDLEKLHAIADRYGVLRHRDA